MRHCAEIHSDVAGSSKSTCRRGLKSPVLNKDLQMGCRTRVVMVTGAAIAMMPLCRGCWSVGMAVVVRPIGCECDEYPEQLTGQMHAGRSRNVLDGSGCELDAAVKIDRRGSDGRMAGTITGDGRDVDHGGALGPVGLPLPVRPNSFTSHGFTPAGWCRRRAQRRRLDLIIDRPAHLLAAEPAVTVVMTYFSPTRAVSMRKLLDRMALARVHRLPGAPSFGIEPQRGDLTTLQASPR